MPLGETNEEFYQGIYTGQPLNLPAFADSTIPPPLPSMPPAWQPYRNQRDDDQDDKDGPSWVCEMCTFDNHPLMDQCEQCDMPRFPPLDTGTKCPKIFYSPVPQTTAVAAATTPIASTSTQQPEIYKQSTSRV